MGIIKPGNLFLLCYKKNKPFSGAHFLHSFILQFLTGNKEPNAV
jgi:hypothetical protein